MGFTGQFTCAIIQASHDRRNSSMTTKPDDKSSAILSFPQTQTERTKMRNRAECGDRIRAYRKARELSQPQLAAMLGITKNSITNWETGVSQS